MQYGLSNNKRRFSVQCHQGHIRLTSIVVIVKSPVPRRSWRINGSRTGVARVWLLSPSAMTLVRYRTEINAFDQILRSNTTSVKAVGRIFTPRPAIQIARYFSLYHRYIFTLMIVFNYQYVIGLTTMFLLRSCC